MDNPFEILEDRMQKLEVMLSKIVAFIDKQEQADQVALISGSEARSLFQPALSESTLYRWGIKGLIRKRRMGGKVLYSKSEILQAAKTLKTYKTKSPMEMELVQ